MIYSVYSTQIVKYRARCTFNPRLKGYREEQLYDTKIAILGNVEENVQLM